MGADEFTIESAVREIQTMVRTVHDRTTTIVAEMKAERERVSELRDACRDTTARIVALERDMEKKVPFETCSANRERIARDGTERGGAKRQSVSILIAIGALVVSAAGVVIHFLSITV